jgi:hypothetical protein
MTDTTATARDWTAESDYNDTDTIVFQRHRLINWDFATLPNSSLTLVRFEGGTIHIGRPFIAHGSLTRVTNPDFEYAETYQAFKRLAQKFHDSSTE